MLYPLDSLFLPGAVVELLTCYGSSFWGEERKALSAAQSHEDSLFRYVSRADIPDGKLVLSCPLKHSKHFNVMYVKRVPADSRW